MNDNDKKKQLKGYSIIVIDCKSTFYFLEIQKMNIYLITNIRMHVPWLLFNLANKLEDYLMNLKMKTKVLTGMELKV